MKLKKYSPTLGLMAVSLLLFDLCPLYFLIVFKKAETLYKRLSVKETELEALE